MRIAASVTLVKQTTDWQIILFTESFKAEIFCTHFRQVIGDLNLCESGSSIPPPTQPPTPPPPPRPPTTPVQWAVGQSTTYANRPQCRGKFLPTTAAERSLVPTAVERHHLTFSAY